MMRSGVKLGTSNLKHVKVTEADAAILAEMTEDYREALLMTGPYAARAKQIGVKIGTIKSRLSRAKAALVRARKKADQ